MSDDGHDSDRPPASDASAPEPPAPSAPLQPPTTPRSPGVKGRRPRSEGLTALRGISSASPPSRDPEAREDDDEPEEDEDDSEALSGSELELVQSQRPPEAKQSIPGMAEIVENLQRAVEDETGDFPDEELPVHSRGRLVPRRKRPRKAQKPGLLAPPDSEVPPPPMNMPDLEGPASVPNVLELARRTLQSIPPPPPAPARPPIEDDLFGTALMYDQLTSAPVTKPAPAPTPALAPKPAARAEVATPAPPASKKGKHLKRKHKSERPPDSRRGAPAALVPARPPASRPAPADPQRRAILVASMVSFLLGVITTLAVERVVQGPPPRTSAAPAIEHEPLPPPRPPLPTAGARTPPPRDDPAEAPPEESPTVEPTRPPPPHTPPRTPPSVSAHWDDLPPEVIAPRP
jgi:hypothetical protein